MESRNQLSETIGQGDSRRTSLICPHSSSSSSPFTAIVDTALAADSFKAALLGDNNNRGGGLF
jgi:hypothetical protein